MTDKPRHKAAAKPPVSAHPAFPAIVALWFAALLGIGSLVLPAMLFERASEASGLSSIFVAAQAPLGATARIVIALAAAATGALAGLAIAARVAAANDPQAHSVRAAQSAIRPISAHEEFGLEGIESVERAGSVPGHDAELWAAEDAVLDEFPEIESPRDPDPIEPAEDFAFGGNADTPFEDETDRPPAVDTWAQTPAVASLPVEHHETDTHASGGCDPVSADAPHADASAESTNDAGQTRTGEPSIVELVDRFARALQQHREHAQASTAHELSEQDHPLAPPAGANQRDWAEFEGDEFLDEGVDEGYSSLLALKGSSRMPREAVRIDEVGAPAEDEAFEPVVAFPDQRTVRPNAASGATPHGRGAAENALREALEKLQKMSGAA